jgi:hypothetical protein
VNNPINCIKEPHRNQETLAYDDIDFFAAAILRPRVPTYQLACGEVSLLTSSRRSRLRRSPDVAEAGA